MSRSTLLLSADLQALRHTVQIATGNLGRAFDLTGLLTPGGPFADDTDLARWMLEQLDDEIAVLDQGPRASPGSSPPEHDAAVVPAEDKTDSDIARNVLVIYGPDEQTRRAVFDFLRALGLRPLEWVTMVTQTGKPAPTIVETMQNALSIARAIVVLMTPDDVVLLHPELRGPGDVVAVTSDAMQARPNVLIELGMALATNPSGTLVLMFGQHRPVADLGGINFVRITDTPACRAKIAARLRQAGCLVDESGQEWLTAGDFRELDALRRAP